jgi:acetylornithine deacetylase/succinyl-diaminopimelate desuccinylase-like protein
VVALDGAGDERIVNRALASRRFRVLFRGPGGHSWAAFGAPNAVHGAARAAAKLAGVVLPREPRTTLSVGRIGGGLSVNSIPDEGCSRWDLRSTSPAHIERYDRELRAAVRAGVGGGERPPRSRLARAHGVGGDHRRPPGRRALPADPLVSIALDATRLIGRAPELATASTDANVPITSASRRSRSAPAAAAATPTPPASGSRTWMGTLGDRARAHDRGGDAAGLA